MTSHLITNDILILLDQSNFDVNQNHKDNIQKSFTTGNIHEFPWVFAWAMVCELEEMYDTSRGILSLQTPLHWT